MFFQFTAANHCPTNAPACTANCTTTKCKPTIGIACRRGCQETCRLTHERQAVALQERAAIEDKKQKLTEAKDVKRKPDRDGAAAEEPDQTKRRIEADDGVQMLDGELSAPVVEGNPSAPSSDSTASDLKVGDHVITKATKSKDKFNEKKAVIVSVLSRAYKVKLLEGTEKNTEKQFAKNMVDLFVEVSPATVPKYKVKMADELFGETL